MVFAIFYVVLSSRIEKTDAQEGRGDDFVERK